ncbi:MAG TPA: glycoside hydrolase family 2 TIM barrel-domain containing protein [Candidatus Izemoplasmatales bacterium]|nr:glycoside hydrolase family 2 TIM barrel-domain containing protein [Candidatus Izemoplasmatales bacterium]
MRRQEDLNFGWGFRPAYEPGWETTGLPAEGVETVDLPHTNHPLPFHHFNETDYQFVSSYERTLRLPETDRGNRLFLRFGGVMTACMVYLNGDLVGEHEGGFTPFSFEVTDRFRFGEENRLFVKVDSREIKDIPPFGNVVDYLCYGGIYREVALLVRPQQFIQQLFVKTMEAPSLLDTEMLFDLRALLADKNEMDAEWTIEVRTGDTVVFTQDGEGKVSGEFSFQTVISDIRRWDLDHPNLYEAVLSLRREGETLDRYSVKFGFRTARFTTEGFILNNRKIKLFGLNRHQSWPHVGFAMPRRVQERDAEILKFELGCNIVRTSHYMQSDHFIRRCDEIGLLVFEEIPGWQYIGNEHFKELTYRNLTDMITTHFNHPAIILWGVRINESPDDDEFYQKTNDIAHALDDSRQTGGVRNFKGSHLLEDVYTYNDFSHTGDNPGLVRPITVTKVKAPYLVTENNGHIFPTKSIDHEGKRLEQALRHLRVMDDNFQHEDACGAIAWCMNDYNTHIEFGSGDRICYHGVMDMFRIPKYAAAVYASQQRKTPVLVVASNMAMGDYSGSRIPPTVIFTNCDYVKVYRNGLYIDTFYGDWETYPAVPNPPVIVDDYYGTQIRDNERWRPGVAAQIKKTLVAFQRYGMKLPLKDKLRALWLTGTKQFSFRDAEMLYGKYIGDWGKEGSTYVYEGYIDDVLVKTVTKGPARKATLVAAVDDPVLVPRATYEATRIVVSLRDEFGNVLPYAHDVVEAEVSPELAPLGPTSFPLVGGSAGFYVRTVSPGKGWVTLRSEGHPELKIEIEIQ